MSSIKRIIAEDGDTPTAKAKRSAPRPQPVEAQDSDDDDGGNEILELTDAVEPGDQEAFVEPEALAEPVSEQDLPILPPAPALRGDLVSAAVASASRQSLTTLSRLIVKPDDSAGDNTLEGLVREMLRPMLKDWLDANLPDLVETMVSKEIARITGQTL